MDPISMDATYLKNAELSMKVDTAVMKKAMDAAVEQNKQLLDSIPQMPKEPGLGASLDLRV